MDDYSAIWLHPHRVGKSVDDTAWRKLLNGADLLAPTKIERPIDTSIGLRHTQAVW